MSREKRERKSEGTPRSISEILSEGMDRSCADSLSEGKKSMGEFSSQFSFKQGVFSSLEDIVSVAPWLLDADFDNAVIEVSRGKIIWWSGYWYDGIWENGIWEDGTWYAGLWLNGIWRNGAWLDGTWENGSWLNGDWEEGYIDNEYTVESPKQIKKRRR